VTSPAVGAHFGVHLGEGIVDITLNIRGPQHVDDLLGKFGAAAYITSA